MALDAKERERSKRVRSYAESLARALGYGIDLVHVEDYSSLPVHDPFLSEFTSKFIEERERQIVKHLGIGKSPGRLSVRPMILEGPVIGKLVRLTGIGSNYKFAVMGTQGRKALLRLLLGSVAEEVIRSAKIPIFVLGPKTRAKPSLRQPILVGTDLGPNSVRAEVFAVKMAIKLKAPVELVYCLFEGMHPVLQNALAGSKPPRELLDLYQNAQKDAERKLERKVAAFERRGIRASFRIDARSTSASDAIIGRARLSKASLIVMGTHGRNLLAKAFLGSTLRAVLLNSSVPVAVIRSRG